MFNPFSNGGDMVTTVCLHINSRHLLNTIANTNGMDSMLLAKWSGRADMKQNRVYDHTSVEDRKF